MTGRKPTPSRPLAARSTSRPPSRNPLPRPGRGVAPLLPRPPRVLPAVPDIPHPDDTADAFPAAPGRSPAATMPRLLTAAEVAAVFRRSERALRDWVRRGYLAPLRVGRAVYFHEEEVRALLGGRMRQAILESRRDRSGGTREARADAPGAGVQARGKTP
ncbi:helix-turn-helix domain-containing protein [Roseomonas mucosa]|uniref:helix-turn-helix domain-containing protein n=1 Tax=Roseomonas mucosa TaxID=207340 RepID=UPI0028CD5098|nr:helix-turn-helix domain-containing protein [Roseomonas mucosa]MDT8351884.1 helix-turn-helix domain-containing protein [Roseomonas mucosa]